MDIYTDIYFLQRYRPNNNSCNELLDIFGSNLDPMKETENDTLIAIQYLINIGFLQHKYSKP